MQVKIILILFNFAEYHAAVFLGDIPNTPLNQRPDIEDQREQKRRRIQSNYYPTATLQQNYPIPYTNPPHNPNPYLPHPNHAQFTQHQHARYHTQTHNHALATQGQNRLPPNYGAVPQSFLPHPSQEQPEKWKYLLDKKERLGKISFSETNPGKIPLFTTRSTKDHPSKHAKEFKKLKFSKEKDVNRELFGLGNLVNALSNKIEFRHTIDRRVNIHFGELNYYFELELDSRIYDLITDEDIKKKNSCYLLSHLELWPRLF